MKSNHDGSEDHDRIWGVLWGAIFLAVSALVLAAMAVMGMGAKP